MLTAMIGPRMSPHPPAAAQGRQPSALVAGANQPKSQAVQTIKDPDASRSFAGAGGLCAHFSSSLFAREPSNSDRSRLMLIKKIAKRLIEEGRFDGAISNIDCLLQGYWFRTDRDLLLMRGQALAAKGDHVSARQEFSRCLQHHPNDQTVALAWLASATEVEANRLANAI